MATPDPIVKTAPPLLSSPGLTPPPGTDLGELPGFVGAPNANFKELLDILTGSGKADLEAYIRELFGDNGGTIAQAIASGMMTPEQAIATLMQSGMSAEQAAYLVQNNLANIPLLTMPGQISSRLSARGGERALVGPGAIERVMAQQEVVRRAQAIQSEALKGLLSASRGSGGGSGGGGGGPKPPERPPLPPIPIPEKPPWWAALVGPLSGALGTVATGAVKSWMDKDKDEKAGPSQGNMEFYNRSYPKYEAYWNQRPQQQFSPADYGSGSGGSYTYTPETNYNYEFPQPDSGYGAGPQYDPWADSSDWWSGAGDQGATDWGNLPGWASGGDTFTGWDDSWSDDNYYW